MIPFQVFDNDIDLNTLNYYLGCEAIAVDTETMGLIPRRDRLCLIQICDDSDHVTVVRISQELSQNLKSAPLIKQLMEASHVTKVFHYARFDICTLKVHLGILTNPIFCTKIASKLARTYSGRHGLKEVVKELEQIELDKSAGSSDWGNVYELSDRQLQYAANDVRYLVSIKNKLTQMLKREGRYELAHNSFGYLPTLVELDLWGYEDLFSHQ
jgi:ribonuclease D